MNGIYLSTALIFVIVALAMFLKERSALSVGGMAIPIVMATGAAYRNNDVMMFFGVFPLVIITILLFVAGLMRPRQKGWLLYWAAFTVATVGMLLIGVLPWLWAFLIGDAQVTVYGWMILVIIGLVAFFMVRKVSNKASPSEKAVATT